MTKATKWHVRPAKTQVNLGIRPVWSESSLSTRGKLRSLAIIIAHSEASDQTGRMPRLIWVFAGSKDHFVGFVMRKLILLCLTCVNKTDFCYFEGFYLSMHVYRFLQTLHRHWYRRGVVWDCKWNNSIQKQQSYGPWFMSKMHYFLNLPEKVRVFIYPCTCMLVCLSPFIMSYCRRVVIPLSFTTVDASHCSYSLLVGPRGDVRVVSSMVTGYTDIYTDNRRKHMRTHIMSDRRSIITTGLKLVRISMLSTEPTLSNRRLRLSKLRAIAVNVTISVSCCIDWYASYTWLSAVCPANTCKEFAGWPESSLDLLVIL